MIGGIITIESMVIDLRYVKTCFISFVLCIACVCSVFADDVVSASAISDDFSNLADDVSQIDGNNTVVVIDNSHYADAISSLSDVISRSAILKPDDSISDFPNELVLYSVTVSNERVSSSDANGFKAVMLGLIGDYETVVTDYEYRNNNNTYTTHSISITEDWAWVSSCAVFLVVIYCFFRLVGGFLCNR